MTAASEILFNHETNVAPLGVIATESAADLGAKIDGYLVKWAKEGGYDKDTFLVECQCPRFASGDGKGLIKSTIRGLDLFIIVDVGNYNCKYQMFSKENSMSPDDHFQDLKRVIQAAGGKGTYVQVGTNRKAGHHNNHFDFDEKTLGNALEVMSRCVWRTLAK